MQRAARPWLSLSLGFVLACGGRYASGTGDEPHGGAGGAAASTGSAGAGQGLASSGGGTPVDCQCATPLCDPSHRLVADPDGCCFHCEVDPDACLEQQHAYGAERARLIDKFSSFGCMQDSDCIAFYNQTSCDSSCVLTTTAARRGLIDGLNNFAVSNCNSDCLPSFVPDCGVPPPARCSAGRCVLQQ